MDYSSSSNITQRVEPPPSLPKLYGEDTLVLMSRDPWCVFAYWEVTEKTAKPVQEKIPAGARIVLRVYDTGSNRQIDYPVGTLVGSWYIQLDAPQRNIAAEIGYLTSDGTFYSLFRSNAVVLPRPDLAELYDSDWMVVEEEFAKIYKMSGGGKQGPSSEEMTRVTEELRRLISRRMRGEAVSGGLAGSAFGSATIP